MELLFVSTRQDNGQDVLRHTLQINALRLAGKLIDVLGMFGAAAGGVLILDEVDLLLHPLRSELNFPIGKKIPLEFTPHRWEVSLRLLSGLAGKTHSLFSLLSSPERSLLRRIGRVLQEWRRRRIIQTAPHLTLLNTKHFTELSRLLAAWLVLWLERQPAFLRAVNVINLRSRNDEAASSSANQLSVAVNSGSAPDPLQPQHAKARASSVKKDKSNPNNPSDPIDPNHPFSAQNVISADPETFWCSKEYPGEAWWELELTHTMPVVSVEVWFRPLSQFTFASGLSMLPDEVQILVDQEQPTDIHLDVKDEHHDDVFGAKAATVLDYKSEELELAQRPGVQQVVPPSESSDGMKQMALFFHAEHKKIWLPSCPRTRRVRLKLLGAARWFAIQRVRLETPSPAVDLQQLSGSGPSLSLTQSGLPSLEWKTRFLWDPLVLQQATPAQRASFEKLPYRARQYLTLGRQCLQQTLPHVLQKVDRVSFGLLQPADMTRCGGGQPRSRALMAVPFLGKDVPSMSSEFAHVDVSIMLTYLGYLYEGLRDTDIRQILVKLQQALHVASGPMHLRTPFVLFERWVAMSRGKQAGGSQPILPLDLLDIDDPAQRHGFSQLCCKSPLVIRWYLHELVFPQVLRASPAKLSCSGQALGSDMLFGLRFGFSGTPSSLLPVDLGQCQYEKLTEGRFFATLSHPGTVAVRVLHNWTLPKLLRLVASSLSPLFSALIDLGALFTGLSNQQVAEALLTQGLQSFKGVVFLGPADEELVLIRGRYHPIPLKNCGLRPEQRFTFYDQAHTTGVDIKQAPNACAAVTLGKKVTFRDFAQACWRLRELEAAQSIVALVPDEIQLLIHDLSHAIGEPNQVHEACSCCGQALTRCMTRLARGPVEGFFRPIDQETLQQEKTRPPTNGELLGWLASNTSKYSFSVDISEIHIICNHSLNALFVSCV